MVVLVLAVTLILGFALPRKQDPEVQRPVSFQIDSQWDAVVKRAEVSVGSQVELGAVVLVLTDPKLEAEIIRLEQKLKEAELGTMEAIAEPGMLGMIGSVPRVIWETSSEELSAVAIAAEPPKPTPARSAAKRDLSRQVKAIEAAEGSLRSVEAQVADATDAVKKGELEVAAAQTNFDQSSKEHEKMQKLYDLGAIPKKQLDESAASADATGATLSNVKLKVVEATARQEQVEKLAVEIRAKLALAREELAEAERAPSASPNTAEGAKEHLVLPPVKLVPKKLAKPKKKVVYGSAPTSFAPVKVNLIEDETPAESRSIEEIRTKLLALKAKRDLLKVRALRAGRVRWIAEPGAKIAVGDPLVEVEY